mmetsp:Transcript_27176/g.67412  ORF Transcript_27176/g.67412 Transcript_27176/m.67412 type:complete len:216 (+) Transcript_27176:1006-1653(+)
MNSQTPSDATMRNASPSGFPASGSHGDTLAWMTSGSGMTPTSLHSPSPIERDMASPMRPLAHTRAGLPGLLADTVPPRAIMRSFSKGRSGLWSFERSLQTTFPLSNPPITHRESPEHATQHSSARMYTMVEVVPHVIAMRPISPFRSISSMRITLRVRHSAGSAWSAAESCSSRSGIDFMQNSEAFSPFDPCPSNTQRSAWLYEPLKGQHTTPLS